MRCSSAKANARSCSSPRVSATRSRSAIRRGRKFSPATSSSRKCSTSAWSRWTNACAPMVQWKGSRTLSRCAPNFRPHSRPASRRSRSCSCTPTAIASMSSEWPRSRELGFPQVSVSHEVSPLIKLVGRGDTTVVDAYLSPILQRYVAQVARDLGTSVAANGDASAPASRRAGEAKQRRTQTRTAPAAPRLMFMMSSGGLTAAELFQGKDAILSGPAAGVVGMAETGREAGFSHLIGFDMGGTSTDVSHFDGEYERAFETEVAGVRMRAPMMLIHTVAAGGGSILHFDGARFRVGPDSAGANPGPKCYRRGGPLALT